ncbi:WD repeat-containing protein 25 [Glycine max]|nr:WD repeat-containing protein 25 [Glycine max]
MGKQGNVVACLKCPKDVYVEAYTCPCVSRHQFDSIFVSQSNGNYVVIFTTTPPYRLNKYKQYEGHVVSGFPINCEENQAHDQACIDVAFHPVIPNVIASCSWDGSIFVFE